MRSSAKWGWVVVAGAMLCPGPLAGGGEWITPAQPDKLPRMGPVPLFWFVVTDCPLVYRREVDVPAGAERATMLIRTSGYVYVYLDGRPVYSWAPRKAVRQGGRIVKPEIPPDPQKVHAVALSGRLTPGRYVLAVSAPAKGFVLHGGVYQGSRRLMPLTSDAEWKVVKLPPTSILEDAPALKAGYNGPAAAVRGGELWAADEDALALAHYAARAARLREAVECATWLLQLLAKGIYLDGDETRGGWAADTAAATRWQDDLAQCDALAGEAADLAGRDVQIPAARAEAFRAAAALGNKLGPVAARISRATAELARSQRETSTLLAARAIGMAPPLALRDRAPATRAWRLTALRQAVAAKAGHPLPDLNLSRYDRLGWINHPDLVDSDLARWSVRVTVATGPTSLTAPFRWRFQTDPGDVGLAEQRQTMGYNIDNQWPGIDGQQSWTKADRFAGYKGAAWYRNQLRVPSEWAGNTVVLDMTLGGEGRVWLNDREITPLGEGDHGQLTFRLRPEAVAFGADNLLAVRVEASGEARGLLAPVRMSCPALDKPEARQTPPVDVFSTPLSPVVLLTPRGADLHIRHTGLASLLRPVGGKLAESAGYSASAGRLAANWVLLQLASGGAGAQRPILLVFQANPAAIECREGLTRVRLARPGGCVAAVRPWAKAQPPNSLAEIAAAAEMWSRAALAVPVAFQCVTRVVRPGGPVDYAKVSIRDLPPAPILEHTYAYEYRHASDEWGTRPLEITPLPALCSYAVDCKFRTLQLGRAVADLQDGGMLAAYRGLKDAETISYRYEIEPYPRMAGFTSWTFAGGDAGVKGNRRELELMAYAGTNSFRPQHNWSDEPPPRGMFPPADKRSRVTITADYCNVAGIGYLNNPDQQLGQKADFIHNQYAKFIRLYFDHTLKIARQLADRPFWAVGYDLINEPFDHKAEWYNPAMKELTAAVRAVDARHLLYIEPPQAWGSIDNMHLVQPTGDPLTVYSFHDYTFRLRPPRSRRPESAVRWPNADEDISQIYRRWLPAFVYQIRNGVCIHCGEFGGFDSGTDDLLAQKTLLNDFFRVFDQFGMHLHYYSGRGAFQWLPDGSVRPSNVVRAFQAYFARGDFNLCYPRWPGALSGRGGAPE